MLLWLTYFTAVIAILAILGAIALVIRQRTEARKARERVLQEVTGDVGEESVSMRLVVGLKRIGDSLSKGGYSRSLGQNLARAGFHARSAPAVFMGAKFMLLVVGAGAGLALSAAADFAGNLRLGVPGFLAVLAFMLPNLYVDACRKRRSSDIKRHLPDALDLLEICVSSGMGLDQAWTSVASEVQRVSQNLADEMELTSLEMRLGLPRPDALRHMADRTGADEISSLVALMIQSERFGASIVDALRTFAGSMRETSAKHAEEVAEKMAVRMLLPMVLFIFPALLIVLLGPVVLVVQNSL